MSQITSDLRKPRDAGYFRIGNEVLEIPPESISTNRILAIEETPTLRTQYPTAKRSGHSRIDINVQWKALALETDSSAMDYRQWRQLRNIISMVRAAPFVEVYNSHLAHVLKERYASYSNGSRIAVALRQIQLATHPDIVDCLQCTLVMSVFNFAPYTSDFAYLGKDNKPDDADRCDLFTSYLDTWRQQNLPLDEDPQFGWLSADPGCVTFNWRQYTAVSLLDKDAAAMQQKASSLTAAAVARPAPSSTPRVSGAGNGKAPAIRIDPTAKGSTAGNYSAALVKFAQCIFAVESDHGKKGTMPFLNNNPGNLRPWIYKGRRGPTNIDGSLAGASTNAVSGAFAHFKTMDDGWDALYRDISFKASQGYTIASGMAIYAPFGDNNNPVLYANTIAATMGVPATTRMADLFGTQVAASTPAKSTTANPAAAAQPQDLNPLCIPDPDVAKRIAPFTDRGWCPDHHTESVAFLFWPNTIRVDGSANNYPHQVSVVIANNLAQIPLAGFAFPTYQHVAPCSTLFSITMISKSTAREGDEPWHPNAEVLSDMESTLDSQVIEMRKEFRSAASVHRMQNVLVRNKILNLAGIHSFMVQSIDTDMVPESPDLLQITLTGSVFSNVYENRDAWRVRTITDQGAAAVLDILNDPKQDLEKLAGSPEGQKAIQPLIDYQKSRQARDKAPLIAFVQSQYGKLAALGPTNPQYPAVPFPNGMADWSNQQTTISDALKRKEHSGGYGFVNEATLASITDFTAQYPDVAKRFADTQHRPSYGDYLIASTAAGNAQVTAQVDAMVDTVIKNGGADPILALYDQLLDAKMRYDPAFSTAEQELEKHPQLKSKFEGLCSPPGQDPFNQGHGAYSDFGLQSMDIQGLDANPAYYFFDHSREMYKDYQSTVDSVAADAAQVSLKLAQGGGKDGGQNGEAAKGANTLTADTLQADIASRAKRAVPPPYSMARAFPTFKLFLLEENNNGVFYAFDDFYSYSAVISMEIIRYQDQPDMAVIQIGNATNLLTHRLHDNSVLGKLEQDMSAPWTIDLPAGSEPTSTPEGAQTAFVAQRTVGNVTSGVAAGGSVDLVRGFGQGKNIASPFQYFALQTGTKLQVRMGFSNNPDMLFPVFTGKVTQLETGDIITITAQSFMIELMDYPGEQMPTGRLGGITPFFDRGDTEGVMGTMLEAGTARHFGHWQMAGVSSDLMRGYTWQAQLAPLINALGGPQTWTSLLANGYDRSRENVLVNKSLNADGTYNKEQGVNRTYFSERGVIPMEAPEYKIPNDPGITPWRVIQDVARRYPECILAVKPYGFPYGADATLVFGNPNDWYLTRRALYGEGDLDTVSTNGVIDPTKGELFRKWWASPGGEKSWLGLMREYNSAYHQFDQLYYFWAHPEDTVGSSTAELIKEVWGTDFESRLSEMRQAITNGGLPAFQKVRDAAVAAYKYQIGPFGFQWLHNLLQVSHSAEYLHDMMMSTYRNLQGYMTLAGEHSGSLPGYPNPGARLQPIRKWHLITQANIVRNNISLNENFHNAVSVNKSIMKANASIPDQYERVLNCDPMIVDVGANVSYMRQGNAYAQSFLKAELGRMYRGELELTAVPEIEPYDIIMLNDASRGIRGPIEVESVIHSFTLEGGYTTIVKPRAMILVNEAASAGLLAAVSDLFQSFVSSVTPAGAVQTGAAGAATAVTTAAAVKGGLGAVAAGGSAAAGATTAATEATVMSITGGVASSAAVQLAADGAVATGTAVATSLEVTAGAASLMGSAAVIGITAAILAYPIYMMACDRQEANPLYIMPLAQYDRPWVAGLEGWRITNLGYRYKRGLEFFWANEVSSTIEGFKQAKQIADNTGH